MSDVFDDESGRFKRCDRCGQKTHEKVYTSTGIIFCLSLWWICGLGYFICKCLREDFCETCYVELFMVKAKEQRMTKLLIHDYSLNDQPDVDETVKEEPTPARFVKKEQ